jgi:hypothetical protein
MVQSLVLPRWRRATLFLAALVLVAGQGCRGGCSSSSAPVAASASPAERSLAWFPAETRIVIALDFAQLRAAPLWSALGTLATADPADRQKIQELARRTGFDPLTQVDSLVVAFPEEARAQGGMGVILRGRGLDEGRLIAYVREQVTDQGDDVFSFRRAGRTLWATRREPTTAGFFIGDGTLVFGAGGWAEKMAELSGAPASSGPTRSATTNAPLVHLVERAGPARALWAAAIVPAATRAALAADPHVPAAASVERMALGVDIGAGVDVRLISDVATHAEAEEMTRQVGAALLAGKRSPQVMLLGLAPYLDGIAAQASGVSCEVTVHLSAQQTTDAVERLRAFLTLARQGVIPGFPRPF